MKISGQHVFEASREEVWKALLDPKVLAGTLPGFERLDEVGENVYEGALNIRIGPVQGQFKGKLELSELDPSSSYRMKMSGKGAPGFVDAEGQIRLESEGSSTRLHYDLDAQVGGRIAGVGQRLLDSSTKVLSREALAGLDRHFTSPSSEGSADGEVAAPEPPSQAEFAAKVAKGVLADLIPRQWRPAVFGIGLVLYTLAVVLLTRACSG